MIRGALLALGVVAAVLLVRVVMSPPGNDWVSTIVTTPTLPSVTTTTSPGATPVIRTTTTTVAADARWVAPSSTGQPWGTVPGLLTFRGNPTRSYYGAGPVPADPEVAWRFPDGPAMCSRSSDGGNTRTWCGSGWSTQPAVFERDGKTWVVAGAYSGDVHFLDAGTGERLRQDFVTGDIIRGSVTVDPDGYPLVYIGSGDNKFRVISFDTDPPTELWALDADDVTPSLWNDDWDGAGLVIDDYLFVGGENSQLHVVKLNRGFSAQGLAAVSPQLVFNAPGWDDELLQTAGINVSIENSVAISGDTLYFANSGGLVQGWDIGGLGEGDTPERVFRFWTGDDTDATVVIDSDGSLYVASEFERNTARSREVGQIMKLDPSREDPLVWGVQAYGGANGQGVLATPGLHRDLLIVPTDGGNVHGLDKATGEIRWTMRLQGPVWSSPAIVDNVWIQADCAGWLYAFDVSDTAAVPTELWRINLSGCIESTPAVWDGLVTVGTRAGWIYGVR